MRATWVVVVGCGAGTLPSPSPPAARVPHVPHVAYEVLPGELGDPGVLEHLPHRARLAMIGRAYFGIGRDEISRDVSNGSDVVVPVVGETRDFVRVVSDEDDARLALWIQRGDLATTVLVPVQLVDATGAVPREAGVWLEPGVFVGRRTERARMIEVDVVGDMVIAPGWVPRELVGNVWVGPTPREPALTGERELIAAGIVLRADANTQAAPLARASAPTLVKPIATRGAWTLVELEREALRVRGFVPTASLERGPFSATGTGHGSGYGISDTDHVDVPASACLYDRVGGDVIGVNTKTRERYGFSEKGSAHVYVNTPWGLALVVLVAAGDGAWESCAKPSGP